MSNLNIINERIRMVNMRGHYLKSFLLFDKIRYTKTYAKSD